MVDARVSGARAERRAGSSPVLGTLSLIKSLIFSDLIFYYKVRVNRMSTDLKSSPDLPLLFRGKSS